jgi:hypothetical protein
MITYTEFITKYPAFSLPPYDLIDITDKLEEISLLFPQIYSCLPENTQLLATNYALRHLLLEECNDAPGVIEEVESRNDKIKYSLGGKGFDLINSNWGSKLIKLFKTYGCYTHVGTVSTCKTDCC